MMYTEIKKAIPCNPKVQNKHMMDFQVISRRQVELAINIRAYRCNHHLSQEQFARIATVYGSPQKIKFSGTEISKYEKYQTIPSEKKMFVLLAAMNIDLDDLVA